MMKVPSLRDIAEQVVLLDVLKAQTYKAAFLFARVPFYSERILAWQAFVTDW